MILSIGQSTWSDEEWSVCPVARPSKPSAPNGNPAPKHSKQDDSESDGSDDEFVLVGDRTQRKKVTAVEAILHMAMVDVNADASAENPVEVTSTVSPNADNEVSYSYNEVPWGTPDHQDVEPVTTQHYFTDLFIYLQKDKGVICSPYSPPPLGMSKEAWVKAKEINTPKGLERLAICIDPDLEKVIRDQEEKWIRRHIEATSVSPHSDYESESYNETPWGTAAAHQDIEPDTTQHYDLFIFLQNDLNVANCLHSPPPLGMSEEAWKVAKKTLTPKGLERLAIRIDPDLVKTFRDREQQLTGRSRNHTDNIKPQPTVPITPSTMEVSVYEVETEPAMAIAFAAATFEDAEQFQPIPSMMEDSADELEPCVPGSWYVDPREEIPEYELEAGNAGMVTPTPITKKILERLDRRFEEEMNVCGNYPESSVATVKLTTIKEESINPADSFCDSLEYFPSAGQPSLSSTDCPVVIPRVTKADVEESTRRFFEALRPSQLLEGNM